MINTARWTQKDKDAVREMLDGGELYVVVGWGDQCARPPKLGSGTILGNDVMRISSRTVARLRQLGVTMKPPYRLLDDVKPWAELIADGLPLEIPAYH